MKRIAHIALVSLLFLTGRASAEVVTQCGQEVRAGHQEADLDCSGAPDESIFINTSLDLNGHTLTAKIECLRGYCGIVGPGTVRGCVNSFARVRINGISFVDDPAVCEGDAIYGADINVADSSFQNYRSFVLAAVQSTRGSITVSNSSFDNSGLTAALMLTSYRTGDERGGRIRITDTTITRSGHIRAPRGEITVRRSTIDEALGAAIVALDGRTTLAGSAVTRSESAGISGGVLKILDSEVSGSCQNNDAPPACADILVAGVKKSAATACGTSYCSANGGACGICSDD